MYKEETVDRFLGDISSKTSTPGGGSVSAFVGTLGACLVSMSAGFTLGKEGFNDYEDQVNDLLAKSKEKGEELMALMEEDIGAYNDVKKAFALSKSTEDDKARRSIAIQNAFMKAIDVPLRTMRSCLEILAYSDSLVNNVNPNLITEVGVAGLLADAALKGSMLNIEFNLNYIKDEEVAGNVKKELKDVLERAGKLIDNIMEKVKNGMANK